MAPRASLKPKSLHWLVELISFTCLHQICSLHDILLPFLATIPLFVGHLLPSESKWQSRLISMYQLLIIVDQCSKSAHLCAAECVM